MLPLLVFQKDINLEMQVKKVFNIEKMGRKKNIIQH